MKQEVEIPKMFWKCFDLYRRKQISIQKFSDLSGLAKREITKYLKML